MKRRDQITLVAAYLHAAYLQGVQHETEALSKEKVLHQWGALRRRRPRARGCRVPAPRGWCAVKQGPPCPLCDAPLTLPEGALVQRMTRGPRPTKLTRYVCACGVEADVGASAVDGSPAVFCFTPNRVLRVRKVRPWPPEVVKPASKTPHLTPPQLALLRRLPDSPADGLRCYGGKKVTARKLVALGLAKCVGFQRGSWAGPPLEYFNRTPEGKARVE